jgi:uncharacterized protein (TIGR04255 family)
MTAERHLPRAPIREALINLRVAFVEREVTLPSLRLSRAELREEYPTEETLRRGAFGIDLEERQPVRTTVDHAVFGYRYRSQDGTRVVQFRRDGFTFSQLEPYQTWGAMKEHAQRVWVAYRESASPTLVTRVATRYVNVIRVRHGVDLSVYFVTPPRIPPALPQAVPEFFTRVSIRDPDSGAMGLITQVLEGTDSDPAPVVLDIDVFLRGQFDAGSNEYWVSLEDLPRFKNRIFFESLTDDALEAFV